MKITVLGCGALGQLWMAAALSRQGHIVQGRLRVPQSVCAVDVISPQKQESRLQLPTNNTEHLTKSDLLLGTLKAWQISGAVWALLPQLWANCTILLLHDGLGTREELSALVQPLIIGTTTNAAHREETKIHHVYAGTTRIGPGKIARRNRPAPLPKCYTTPCLRSPDTTILLPPVGSNLPPTV